VTPESAALRESIRQGHISAQLDHDEFDFAVARVYEVEREEESTPLYGHAVINWRVP
jgi:hypothetical protein